MPNYQGVWSLTVQMQNRTGWPTFDGSRGIFGGGEGSNVIDFVTIASEGNASDFGDLTVTNSYYVSGGS